MAQIQYDFYSESLGMNTTVNLVLPQGFTNTDPVINNEKKYRQLYLLHGYNGNHTDYLRFTSLEKIANEHRLVIILPQVNNSYYTNMVYGANYLDYLELELPKHLESLFSLSPNDTDKFIFGISMGGYGALKIALRGVNKFSRVGSMSGALNIDYIVNISSDKVRQKQMIANFGPKLNVKNTEHDLFYLLDNINIKTLDNIYINCGENDFLYNYNLDFIDKLTKLEISHIFESFPGSHDWNYWDKQLYNAINNLLKK